MQNATEPTTLAILAGVLGISFGAVTALSKWGIESLKAARTIDFEWLSADPSVAYSRVVDSNYSPSHAAAVIVTSAESRKLSASENSASTYDSPVLVIDESDPVLENNVDASQFALHCTPAINLRHHVFTSCRRDLALLLA